jgi:cytochrome c553
MRIMAKLFALLIPLSQAAFGQQSDAELVAFIESGNVDAVKMYVESDGDVNHIVKSEGTLLQVSLKSKKSDVAKYLIESGANTNQVTEDNDVPPLSLAIRVDNLDLLEQLLLNNANPNGKNRRGFTPIFRTMAPDRGAAREMLIKYGADVNKDVGGGFTPLMNAMSSGNKNAVSHLIANKATVDGKSIAENSICARCHSNKGPGITRAAFAPHLAGQHAEYIAKQLRDYLRKKRTNIIMDAPSSLMTEEIILALATYYEGLPRVKNTSGSTGDRLDRGKVIFERICSSCHGLDGIATQNNLTPTLAGLNSIYVANQLKFFKEGTRSNDSDSAMRTVVAELTRDHIRDVSAYIQSMD